MLELSKLFNSSESYKYDFTELKRYAYANFLVMGSSAVMFSGSIIFNQYNDPYRPLLCYFNEHKYIVYYTSELVDRLEPLKVLETCQEIIACDNDIAECLRKTIEFNDAISSIGGNIDLYFASEDDIIILNRNTMPEDFKIFNLTDSEYRELRKALIEFQLS